MVSIKTDKCKTPRPKTINLSALSVSWTRKAKFFSSSLVNLSFICLEVTNLPSFPKKGESLMVNNMLMVGSSMAMVCSPSGCSQSATVSPISKPSSPTMAQMSPVWTCSTFLRPKPSKTCSSLILDFTMEPFLFTKEIFCPALRAPRVKRPMAIRPVKDEKSKEVINICVFPSGIFGAGIWSITISNKGSMFSVFCFQSVLIQFCLAEP